MFVLSAILNASILEQKISTRYHVYDCDIGDIDLPSVFVEMAGMQSSFAETSIVQDIVHSEELDIRRDEDSDSKIDDDDDAEN